MGEAYRADDTKLGHAVARKFLPRRGAVDAPKLDRLRAEVRLGRQVSHPNVCRIYDIGESPEGSFIAMEYVDEGPVASRGYVMRRRFPVLSTSARKTPRCPSGSARAGRSVRDLQSQRLVLGRRIQR
jgi:serine/threonine protein kinase